MTDDSRASELERQVHRLQQRIDDLEQHLRARQERVVELEHYLQGRQRRVHDLEERYASEVLRVKDQYEHLRSYLETLHASTAWRLTAPVRGVMNRLKPGHRFALRRVAKVCYWALTPHLMLKRLRFLRSRSEQQGGSTPPSGNAASSPGSSHP